MLILFLGFAFYAGFLLYLYYAQLKVKLHPVEHSDTQAHSPWVTLVIPFRNEAVCLPDMVRAVAAQTYEKLEVIFVDDASSDAGVGWLATHLPVNAILLPAVGIGKKSALQTGVAHARGELIVTTDADCTFPPDWIARLVPHFRGGLMAMPVRLPAARGLFRVMEQMEFASVQGMAMGLAAIRKPRMVSGAGLMYRKQDFLDLNPYGTLQPASGDDEFLMNAMLQAGKEVYFSPDLGVTVTTQPAASLAGFLRQRIRWAGKWKTSRSGMGWLLAPLLALLHGTWLALLVWVWGHPGILSITALMIKFLAEAYLIRGMCIRLGMRWNLAILLLLELVYPWYIVGVGLASLGTTPAWKGREIS